MADMVVKGTFDDKISPALSKIEKNALTLNNVFLKLKTTLATISLGAAISGTLRFADAIQDISDTTGIATQTILGFSNAVAQNGGNADQAQQSLLKFVQTIGEAIDGSNGAQKALADVGITLKDIQTLSEENLLANAVAGLGKMTNATQRLAAQTALFGKNARGVNFPGVAGGMGTAVAEASQYAAAIKSGADAQQSLENNLRNLTTALLRVIQPLNDIVKTVNISVSAFESLIKTLVYATAAYLTFTKGLGAVTTIMNVLDGTLKKSGGLFALITTQIKRMGTALLSIFTGVGRATGAIAGGTSALFSFSAAIAGALRFLLRFAGVVAIIMAVAEAVNFLSKTFFDFDILDWVINKFKDLYDVAAKFFNFSPSDRTRKEIEKQTEAQKDAAAAADAFAERQKKLALDINKVGDAYAKTNVEQLQKLALEKELIGKSEEQKEVILALEALYDRQTSAIAALIEKRKEYAQGTEEQKASLGIIDAEIAKIKKLSTAQGEALPKYISDLQSARLLEQDRVNNLDRITQALQRQQDQAGVTTGIYSNLQKQIGDIQFGKEQKGRSLFEQQRAEIERNIQLLEADMAGAVTEAFTTEDGISNVQQYAIELQKVYDLTNQLKEAQLEQLDISKDWATGWADAYNSYMENATNAAKQAGDVFSSVTSNMNSAIDTFVNTGKLSFGGLARSIIADLAKIELKAAAAKIFSGGGGGFGGIFSGIASLFGFANGGNPPVNKPSIVGEKGPELFIPKTQGTIIPNGASPTTGGNNTYITNNITAVDAKSVAQLFAENRKTLFGTVEMARKEMSYGR
jgi:lambda family phage tail tape measure protein